MALLNTPDGKVMPMKPTTRWPRFGWLLLAPFVGLLWVPFYNSADPKLWGFPFFYWYQLAWVPLTVVLTLIVYRNNRHDD